MHRSTLSSRAALILLLAACTSDSGSLLSPEPGESRFELSDGAHSGPVPGFYFLPPMVPRPTYTGTFDGALSPRVEVCELSGAACSAAVAHFSMSSGVGSEVVRVDPAQQHYVVNWHTDRFRLDPARHYRISVFAGPLRLGFADVDVTASAKELKNVDTGKYVPLLNGKTLPIKFRVETGIVATVDVAPDSATILPGQVQQFTTTLRDLHGAAVSAPATWTTSSAATATIDGSGLATGVAPGMATVTASSGAASGTAVLVVQNPNTAPTAGGDAFAAIGNVTVPVDAPGVLGNDSDAEGDPLAVVAGTFATAGGGIVTVAADGSFSYLSAAGFTGTDSFDYVVSDGQAADTATVQLSVNGRVWYVRNDPTAPGDGRDTSPFTTLKAAESASSAGETVFLLAGDGSSTGYDEGIALKTGQVLTGQGVSGNVTMVLNGKVVVLLAAGSAPRITRSTAGATIRLSSGNTVQGVNIASTAGAGISGNGFGTFTAGSLSVSAVGGPALDLENGTVAASFALLSSTESTGAGLRLHALYGTLAAAGGSISGAAGAGVDVGGGTANISYAGDVAHATGYVASVTGRSGGAVTLSGDLLASGRGILVQNNTGGSVSFTGSSKVLNTAATPAVSLLNNSGAATSFSGGGLSITTTTGTGFSASSGGTVTVTGANNVIGAVGGTAISVVNTTVGTGGLTFRAISASGGANGIVLENTGTSYGLQVTGNGSAGSGGVIQGTVGADGSNSGIGVYLSNAHNVELSWMQLNDHPNYAIRGTNLSGFHLARSRITGTNGTNAAAEEGSVYLAQLSGVASITGSHVEGAARNNVRVANSSGVLNRLTLSGDTIGLVHSTTGDDGVRLEALGGTFNVTVQNTRFTGARGEQFQLMVLGSASADLTFTGNHVSNNHPNLLSGAVVVSVGQSAAMTYDISSNSFRDARATALHVAKQFGGGSGNATAAGTIQNNVVGVSGAPNSGSLVGSGIEVVQLARGSHTTRISGNQVRGYNNHGIHLSVGGASEASTGVTHDGMLSATVQGNTVSEPGNNGAVTASRNGVHLNSGTNSGDDYQVCLNLSGNVVSGAGADPGNFGLGQDYRLRQRQNTTVRMPGYTGAATDAGGTLAGDVSSYLAPRTSGAFTLNVAASSNGYLNTSGGAACPAP